MGGLPTWVWVAVGGAARACLPLDAGEGTTWEVLVGGNGAVKFAKILHERARPCGSGHGELRAASSNSRVTPVLSEESFYFAPFFFRARSTFDEVERCQAALSLGVYICTI